jgi:hypothetical protein
LFGVQNQQFNARTVQSANIISIDLSNTSIKSRSYSIAK